MPPISQTTHILSFSSPSLSCSAAIVIGAVLALSLFAMVVAEQESSHVLQLPSEAAGERQSVCGAKTTALRCPVKCFRTSLVCGVNGMTYSFEK
ncbi:hypothetical protein QN277_023542 [Acacia crassicarpa]|uniref:Uncharacterized protein n=1 Tax=Acacia crassicarpa TaxID=499986 RepID=A0AAE1JJ36_9FABA|nr:hypothetical protein QN277_023542 [Acacia crassicarpa]